MLSLKRLNQKAKKKFAHSKKSKKLYFSVNFS
jgi:hypothetical protein